MVWIWTIACRGLMQNDPVICALEDRVSLAFMLAAGLAVTLALCDRARA